MDSWLLQIPLQLQAFYKTPYMNTHSKTWARSSWTNFVSEAFLPISCKPNSIEDVGWTFAKALCELKIESVE